MRSLSDNTENKKILFQFILMLVAALIGGICFIKAVEPHLPPVALNKILANFSNSPLNYVTFGGFIQAVFKAALPYFISTLLVFIFSFSYVCYIISDIILALNGFAAGVSMALLCVSAPQIKMFSATVFIISIILPLIVLFCFTYYSALFSLNIRVRSSNGRMILPPAKLLKFILKTLTALGTYIIILLIRILAVLF